MILSIESLDNTQLRFMLERTLCEFNFNNQDIRDSIHENYHAKLNQDDLIGLEFFANYYLITSARFRYRHFYTCCGPELTSIA